MMKLPALSLLLACAVTGCSSDYPHLDMDAKYTNSRDFTHFSDYVYFLKQKAAGSGVAAQTLNGQNQIQYIHRAIELDRQQMSKRRDPNAPPPAPNPNGVTNYLSKVLTQNKVNLAVQNWGEYYVQIEKASRQYGVQKEYLVALWGMESSFGKLQGNYDVLSVLATLAFDGRREKLFTQEFVNALKILEQGSMSRDKMKGSWAGAMGQTQFMPTSYLNYATDGNNDGQKDIWNSHYDVFASIANYLSTVGWDDQLPWGVEVKLAQPVDASFVGIEKNKSRSLAEWQSLGIYLAFPTQQESNKLTALNRSELWLVMPDQAVGRAFLVSNNYRTLMDWNKSNYFAVSIGKFADRILAAVEE